VRGLAALWNGGGIAFVEMLLREIDRVGLLLHQLRCGSPCAWVALWVGGSLDCVVEMLCVCCAAEFRLTLSPPVMRPTRSSRDLEIT
jgi:hypothetical protein